MPTLAGVGSCEAAVFPIVVVVIVEVVEGEVVMVVGELEASDAENRRTKAGVSDSLVV